MILGLYCISLGLHICANASGRSTHQAPFKNELSLISLDVPPDPSGSGEPFLPTDVDASNPERLFETLRDKLKPKFPPLDVLPCANVQVVQFKACPKQGTKTCSACKLVSYCSKVCYSIACAAKNHWRIHKRDCKNQLKSDDWKPAWVVERRFPTSFFIETNLPASLSAESLRAQMTEFDSGLCLWGNMPAVDLINLAENEKDKSLDLSIALVASGDLRHVVRTISALPEDYSGHLQVLLNDVCPPVVARNIVILLILGTVPDETMAVDIALHFWYSVFMPAEYSTNIMAIVASFLLRANTNPEDQQPLGQRSSLDCLITEQLGQLFRHFGMSTILSMAEAQNEYDRVRTASSRGDYRDRMLARLKPSHRLAFQEFRRFGIVLPFGAMNAHFNVPNASLFSLNGKWLQTDYADPLAGWDIGEILDAGTAQGAQPEDIYGCLYFFLSHELRTFARRLRELHISFRVVATDATILSRVIREDGLSGFGIPASARFDRIDVSNIFDLNYVGIRDVLTHWGPLLKESRTAALVGYFMNWAMIQPDGRACSAGDIESKKLIRALIEKGRFPGLGPNSQILDPRTSFAEPARLYLMGVLGDLHIGLVQVGDELNAMYDNSKAFAQYLKHQKLEDILRKTRLKLRKKHTIVPHGRFAVTILVSQRYKVPLDAAPNTLPDFSDNETWYQYVRLVLSYSHWFELTQTGWYFS
ncbi:uncharacterized protein EDB91DRAFT_1235835 [Suillus paluster]|uniref:uncharacterized protein n=1 Tax=Suillus paluster TaxID=48578 RepID=UPI001B885EEB|nr:uncharacterized protein EDB91DRAFT_1235835 [Suillus paluster]KAG1747941.1 hypothetical protein EDB91DRAFT_1235835 [Suillus paluster]